jgi:DHA1 family bicyclomycin/chloramphenicol resistance-like MFS transporter
LADGTATKDAAAAPPVTLGFAALLTALTGFGPLSTDLYLPALPGLVPYFGSDVATVQLTLSLFLVGFAVSQLIYGPVSDRFGRRPALLAGIALFIAGTVACALAPTIETLILARFVQAVGACSGPVLARAVLRDVAEPRQAARLLSYMSMTMAIAPAVGPILGGVLTDAFGWRSNFWLLFVFGAAMLVCVLAALAETNRRRNPQATQPLHLLRAYGSLLGHRGFVGFAIVVAGTYSTIFAFISGSSFVLVDGFGLSPVAYGLCFGVAVIGYILGAFGAGRLAMRLGIERMVAVGTAIMLAGAIVMAGLAWAGVASVPAVLAPFIVVMAGTGLTLSSGIAGAIAPFPHMAGTASSLLGFLQMLIAATVGVAIGHATAADAVAMATAILLSSLAAFAGYRLILRPGRP